MKEHLLNLLWGLASTLFILAFCAAGFLALAWGGAWVHHHWPESFDSITKGICGIILTLLFLGWSYTVGADIRKENKRKDRMIQ